MAILAVIVWREKKRVGEPPQDCAPTEPAPARWLSGQPPNVRQSERVQLSAASPDRPQEKHRKPSVSASMLKRRESLASSSYSGHGPRQYRPCRRIPGSTSSR